MGDVWRVFWWTLAVAVSCDVESRRRQSRRRLSKSDTVQWIGTQESRARPEYYVFVHIPKAAGASFLKDSPKHMGLGSRMKGSHEKAVYHNYTQAQLAKPRAQLVLVTGWHQAASLSLQLGC